MRAGVSSVMAAYNKVNGTYSAESVPLLTDILRKQWGFTGFVMSDWGATHSAAPSLAAGLDLEMPNGRNFATFSDAVKTGTLDTSVVDQAVRRILAVMDRKGLLQTTSVARPVLNEREDDLAAQQIAAQGAVLLKNEHNVLPLRDEDFASLAVIGATAKTLLVGGCGSARVLPLRKGVPLDALQKRAPANATIVYAPGNDLDGVVDPPIDFVGANALPAGTSRTWTSTITVPTTGRYEFKLQTQGGRGSITVDPDPDAPVGTGRGGRGGGGPSTSSGRGGGGGLLTTVDGLSSRSTAVQFTAGGSHRIVVTGTAGETTPLQIRLAWITPEWPAAKIDEAVAAARLAKTAIVFAYDEGSEGRDRSSLSLPGNQDALIDAVAQANPHTVVVLTTGDPVLMPWADRTAAILQMWYPGQAGAEAIASVLTGEVNPSGKLPVTFPRRAEDAPTSLPERYPGVNGHGTYSEGIFVGYRWYDDKNIDPLFPFGHGLSYTTFAYSNLRTSQNADGFVVMFELQNSGSQKGEEVAQVYVGRPDNPPVPMAVRALAGFERVALNPGETKHVTIHIAPRELSYWSTEKQDWVLAPGPRPIFVGSSSRDLRLRSVLR